MESATTTTRPKKYVCSWEGCGKGFTRSDHLQRHSLNHGVGHSTCPRCSLHFKRADLLDRHMARHQRKDEEAGGEGLGVVETRKKLWRDAGGNIVSKRPSQSATCRPGKKRQPANSNTLRQQSDTVDLDHQRAVSVEPLSPPRSMLSGQSTDQLSHQLPELADDPDFIVQTSGSDMFGFLANSSWGIQSSSMNTQMDAPFNEIFNPDTASSFNMPFTTMNNYNWLFDLSDSTKVPTTMQQSLLPTGQGVTHGTDAQTTSYEATSQSVSDIFRLSNEAHANSTPASFSRQPALQQPQNSAQFSADYRYDFAGSQGMAVNGSVSPSSSESQEGINSYFGADSSPPMSTSHEESAHDHTQNQPTRPPNRQMNIPQSPFDPESFSTGPSLRSEPRMDEESRNDILDLLMNARPKTPDGSEISPDHPLLSLSCMQNYLDLFFSRFNVAYPLLHQATFDPSETETLLLLAVVLLGATYSEKSIHRLAVCIHDVLRAQIFQHSAFSATPELWMLQTILLVECFGKSRAGQKQHDMAHLFHGLLINLIRRSDCQTVRQPNFSERPGDLEDCWRKAIDVELRKRLAFLCFLWDTQHAILFSQSLCMSSFELRTTLPCNQATWEASTAEEWWRHAKKEPQIPYLSVLKAYMNPDSGAQIPELNALSRLLVLHGLMSIQWDLKRRDQTSLGFGTSDQKRWQDRLAQSYDAWKADFDTYCMNMTLSLSDSPSRRAEFTRFSTATVAIYHAAHITLNVEILDLQIYAGARHIIGHPVTRADYDRSRSIVKAWAKPGGSTPAAKAAWHAAHLLRDGIMNLENWDVNNAFHYPWCLYLSTLTCWVFHFANVADKSAENLLRNVQASSLDNDPADKVIWRAKAEMNALISSMTSVVPGDLWRVLGKHSTSGLITVMSAHLANVRWAVIHEGRKVLRGIPLERSVQEYNASLE